MSHLDEGTLHALLDGELATTEVAEIQAHLGSCSACGLRLREVKEVFAEADRLIASVDLGAQPAGAPPAPAQHEAAAHPEPGTRPQPPGRREPPVHPRPAAGEVAPRETWNDPPPMLLIPDNESAADRRRRRLQRASWAALFVGLVGAGFLGVRLRPQPSAPGTLARSAPAESNAVVSPEEASRPDTLAQRPESSALTLSDKAATAVKPKPAAPRPAAAAAAAAERAKAGRTLAAGSDAPSEPAREERALDEQVSDSAAELAARTSEADTAGTEDIAAVRARAGEALADLDRERRRNQAAAATAALDAERRRRAAAPAETATRAAPAPTPPAPPTIEQRAGIYLRIGLDEASRQLGGPAHVIEGLSPMFMGLARGASVAEADATRPVVRVVYQDSQGRLIRLDQQRLRPGQAPPPAGPLAWLIGGTAMWLTGEASSEILRTYRPRVR